jgi:hypothetical protein
MPPPQCELQLYGWGSKGEAMISSNVLVYPTNFFCIHGNLPLVSDAEMMALWAGRIGASGVVVGISHTFHAIFVHDESLMTSRALSNGNCTDVVSHHGVSSYISIVESFLGVLK